MRYTYKKFKAEYPDDKACLKAVLLNRYGNTCPKCGEIGTKFYPIYGRKGFACLHCHRHIYPLAGTIFHKSKTPLWDWFYAIYQVSVSKNGVNAKELERSIGLTYKTAWRMVKRIS
jgi:transposase-like protein